MVPTRCTIARARKCLSAFAAKMGTERWLVLTSRRGLRGLDQHPRAGGQGRPRWAQPCVGLGRRGRLLALPSRPHTAGARLLVGSQCLSPCGVVCPHPHSRDGGPGLPQRL